MSGKPLLILAVLSLLCGTAFAQDESVESLESLGLRIFFSENSSELMRDYRSNGDKLDAFVRDIKSVLSDPSCVAGGMRIVSYTSPEGRIAFNNTLSEERGEVLKEYLRSVLPLHEDMFVMMPSGENWQGLKMLAKTTGMPDGDRVLEILGSHADYIGRPQSTVMGGPKKELMDLNGGRTWIWMEDNVFPCLRTVCAEFTYTRIGKQETPGPDDRPEPLPDPDTVATAAVTNLAPVVPLDSVATQHTVTSERIVVAPRTNLLLPLLNVGIEVPIGRHFSFAADYYYPWLGHDRVNANCVEALLADVQLRWWIKPREKEGLRGNSLTGSALSVGAFAGYYDFERDMKGFQGEIGCLYLDYSYTFFLARNWRLSLSLGAGVAMMPYRTYTVYTEGGKLIRDFIGYDLLTRWIGPVHAGLVLSIPVMGGKRDATD